MKRDYGLYVEDILNAIQNIEEYSNGVIFEDFLKNRMLIDAIIRNFEVIGEAAKHIPVRFRNKYPDVPWKMAAGLRDKLIHEYFGVNAQVLWDTIKQDLPLLKPNIEKLLKEIDNI
jgi:uncharacterized protein with HEPN domain